VSDTTLGAAVIGVRARTLGAAVIGVRTGTLGAAVIGVRTRTRGAAVIGVRARTLGAAVIGVPAFLTHDSITRNRRTVAYNSVRDSPVPLLSSTVYKYYTY